MKKALLSLAISLGAIGSALAYNTVAVKDSISINTHWTNNQQYLLQGYVYVTSGATLTIDSGVIIKGDKNTKGSLIVERGAKIYAVGTATAPIVFTSSQPAGSRNYGDWGGVILCGKAPINWNGGVSQVEGGPRSLYGGTDATDNSGTMRYVRIEFPGIAFSPNNEINGLTFCGVGNGTQIDHIQVSYSGDDSYEWFGGSVNCKYMIAHRGWDDDFDNDNGWNGKLQFGMSLRDPVAADQSGSKGFESDSYQSGTATGLNGDTSQITKPVFSNMTVVGPLSSPNFTGYFPDYIAGVHIRRGSAMSLLNSVIMGWPCGILFDESSASFGSTTANIGNGLIQIRNTILAGNATYTSPTGNKDLFYVKDGARSGTPTTTLADTSSNSPFAPFSGPYSFFLNPAFGNKIFKTATGPNAVLLTAPFNLTNPNFVPLTTSAISYNSIGNGASKNFNPNNPINYDTSNSYANYNVPLVAPNFSTTKAADGFFTKVNFVGAFAGTQLESDNWAKSWTEFDPVNTDYTTYVNTMHMNNVGMTNIVKSVHAASVAPNPAVTSARLLVDMNEAADIRITVSDIAGKMLQNVFSGAKAKGIQAFIIDLSNVPSGLYFVNIASAKGSTTVKLNVVK